MQQNDKMKKCRINTLKCVEIIAYSKCRQNLCKNACACTVCIYPLQVCFSVCLLFCLWPLPLSFYLLCCCFFLCAFISFGLCVVTVPHLWSYLGKYPKILQTQHHTEELNHSLNNFVCIFFIFTSLNWPFWQSCTPNSGKCWNSAHGMIFRI